MDTIIAGFIVAGCALELCSDYIGRRKFSQFEKTGKTDTHVLVEGMIVADKPLSSVIGTGAQPELVVNQITEQYGQNLTVFKPITIYKSDATEWILPYHKNVKTWETKSKTKHFATGIQISGIPLYFDNKTKFYWNRNRFQIIDNIKTIEKSIVNETVMSAFGKYTSSLNSSTQNEHIMVAIVGDHNEVIQKVRYEYFGISDANTICVSAIILAAAGYIINNLSKDQK